MNLEKNRCDPNAHNTHPEIQSESWQVICRWSILEQTMFAISNSNGPQDRIFCSLWFDWCAWSTLAVLLSSALCRFVNNLATVFTNHRKIWSFNSCQKQAISKNLSTYCREFLGGIMIFRLNQVIIFAKRCHLLKRSHMFCHFTVPLNALFSMTFHVIESSLFFWTKLFFCLKLCRQSHLSSRTFLNNSVSDWAAWRSIFAFVCVHFQNTWSVNGGGSDKSISSCRMFHLGSRVCFSIIFSGPRRHTEPFLCTRQDTFRVGTLSHPVFQTFLFPKNVG